MKELVTILKKQNYQINPLLLCNYKKLKITEQELIMIIYLLNETYNPKEIAKNLDLKLPEVLEIINSLSEKGLLKIELKKINNISVEVINLDNLFDSLGLLVVKKEDNDKDNSIYDTFERELGRTISPMEYEIISSWLKDNSEELILLALKEAVYNNVSSMRYIDRIINNWNKKGIKTKEDVEKSRKEFKKDKKENIELFDYDWLNDESNN
jgi:DNA replication protein